MAPDEKDYVLGTHDEEIARLGLQHRIWKPRVLEAWSRAGFSTGQVLLDVGCGPGWASLDMAGIVGPGGRVHAVDRSRRFLEALEAERSRRGIGNLVTHEIDLDAAALPDLRADGAWARWVFAFLKRPQDLVGRLREALRPGASIVLHEYFDYAAWRMAPRVAELEEFVHAVMESWRAQGGEPDVGLDLPRWLTESGFEVRRVSTHVDLVSPSDPIWQWPRSFIEVGLARIVDLGFLPAGRAGEIEAAIAAAERNPCTRMVTPAVVEILAVRR